MSRSSAHTDLKALAWPSIVTLAMLPVITLALVAWGPDAARPSISATIDKDFLRYALVEPTDRAVVLSWFAVAALAALIGLMVRDWPEARQATTERVLVALAVIGAATIVVGLAIESDATLSAPRWSMTTLTLGALSAGVVLWLAVTRSLRWQGLTILAVLIPGTFYATRLIQLPGKLVDSVNAGYTFGEVMAPGFGHFPLAGFFSQYEHLMGYPIAPLIALSPGHAATIATWWIVLLQAITLVVAGAVAAMASGRRLLWAIIIIVPAWCFAVGAAGQFAFSYFAVNPLRTALPVLAIGAACWGLRKPDAEGGAKGWHLLLVGVVSGVAALNNPEFGLPVMVVVVVTASLAQRGTRAMVVAPAAVIAGALLPFAFYWLALAAAGRSVVWSAWFLYPSIFSSDGFFNVALPAVGAHIFVAALFAAAAATGVVALRGRSASRPGRRRRAALALTLVGGWSLLTLTYYGGRSLVPTLVGGYALQVGWTMACVLPLLVVAWRSAVHPRLAAMSSRVVVAAGAGTVALAVVLVGPWLMNPVAFYNRPPNIPPTPSADVQRALERAPQTLRSAAARGRVSQAMPLALLVESQTGVPSILRFNNPDSVVLSRVLAQRQCEAFASSGSEWVLVNWSTARALRRSAACRKLLGGAEPTPLSLGVAAISVRGRP